MSRARLLISGSKVDQELRSIQQIIVALSDLDSAARTRVINYVFQRNSRRDSPTRC